MIRPRDVYGAENRDLVLKNVLAAGYRISEFRQPKKGDWFVTYTGFRPVNNILFYDSSYPFPDSKRLIVVPL